jgi:diacylglycerol kinase family enzyme
MKSAALAVLNAAARHGTAARRFESVSSLVSERFELGVVPMDPAGVWRTHLSASVAAGIGVVLAAGGDGTVGAVASALIACPRSEEVAFGAIGLGSSNDYQKPFGVVRAGIPLRIDVAGARPRDVARAVFSADGAASIERPFLVSASLGVTARANALFNEGAGTVLAFFKRRWIDGAVLYAALAALWRHADVFATLKTDGEEGRYPISNLSVLKTPFLSGCLRYDTPVEPDSGRLAVNLCHGMSRSALLGTLLGLIRGRFVGRRRTRRFMSRRVEVEVSHPVPLELDGEVVLARHVVFDIASRRILACA